MRIILLMLFSCLMVYSQEKQNGSIPSTLPEWEISLAEQMQNIADQPFDKFRMELNKKFIPDLVSSLKLNGSFHYSFEKVPELSKIYAPDSSFRVLTWVIPRGNREGGINGLPSDRLEEDLTYQYFGTIQMNTDSLKLFPLYDRSSQITDPETEILSSKKWFGCIYYNIIQKEHNDTTYYTLLGWDGKDKHSTIKLAEALYFSDGEPIFGAPIFQIWRDSTMELKNRFVHEFKSGAGVSLNYDSKVDAIVYDFIKPATPESKGAYATYIPDGTADGLLFKNGVWTHIPLVYEELGFPEEPELEDSPAEVIESGNPFSSEQPKEKKKIKKKKRDNIH